MNIVLIHPYIVVRETNIALTEPLGLISLATYLKQVFGEEVNVSILDLYAMGADTLKPKGDLYVKGVDEEARIHEELKRLKPDLIGVTCCFTGYFGEALDVVAMSKRLFPSVPTVMGGAHATLEARSVLRDNPSVDYVVCNEGEITLADLVRALRGELSVESINGLCFRGPDNSIVVNAPRELIADLDVLPIPDRSFIDMEHYKRWNHRFFNFSRKRPVATVITSRGCPFECIFCCTKNLWRRRWRPRSLDSVFKEIEMLVAEYGIREIMILDDQFIMKKERVYEFCDYFIERKLGIAISNIAGISTWLADDDELLIKMRKAGFYKITLPIETGNAETMKFIRKPVDLEQVEKLVAKANRYGYWTGAFFIIGFPYETREQIMETISYAYNSELDFAHFFVAQPYIGTELYEIYEKEKLLKDDAQGTHIFAAWHDTLEMSAKELNEIQERASRGWLAHKFRFYLRPRNIFRSLGPKIKKPADFRYSFGILWMLMSRKIKGILRP